MLGQHVRDVLLFDLFLIEFVIISASVINVLFKTDIVVEFGDNKK